MKLGFWLRWSWRDLKARWLQVVAVALIIALGTGIYSGLGGQRSWREASNDASYSQLNMYDLQMKLADGSYLDYSDLQEALVDIEGVETVDMRLIVPTLVDASTADDTVLASGRIVGVDVHNDGPQIAKLYAADGRSLTSADAGTSNAFLESQFAEDNSLQVGDTLRITGDVALNLVGTGQSPEYFYVMVDSSTFGLGSFAVVFVSLETAQSLINRPGVVNNAVFTTRAGADVAVVQAAIEARMQERFPTVGATFNTKDEDAVHKQLYDDAKNDQATWDLVAMLFLLGAAFGTFNLTGRMVESQRRQIGIGMALGVPRHWLAFRPLLVGVQIAVLGTLFGLILGYGFSQLFASLFKSLIPLPIWKIDLYWPAYIRGAVLGIVLPMVATLIPVFRAVRVSPLDAIRSGNLVGKGGGLSWVVNRLPLPGKSFTQMPFKNVLRAPWRSFLTMLGIAMAITLLSMFVGFLDSFVATMDQAEKAYLHEGKDRVWVILDYFYPTDSTLVTDLEATTQPDGSSLFAQTETGLMLGGTLKNGNADEDIEVSLELYDGVAEGIWRPTLTEGRWASDGIIISQKAAKDLGVEVGDTITLEHPKREGPLAFRLTETAYTVVGLHDNPLRALAYMDMANAGDMGLAGETNLLVVTPINGADSDTIKQAFFAQSGVASVDAINDISEGFNEAIKIFAQVLTVVQGIVVFMAFLIAFNSTTINIDERVREIATMFAFGLPLRTVTRMQMLENLLIGLVGTLVGILLGWLVLNQFLTVRVEEQLEDFQFVIRIAPMTIITSIVLGVLTVALTPLVSIRKMVKMDIPSTLRVME
ncbi:MAG: ABC transporter permease [Anaerolineales bacterium]|nr:ABC transporter permease [Anaerolineales bacterium]